MNAPMPPGVEIVDRSILPREVRITARDHLRLAIRVEAGQDPDRGQRARP